MITNLKTLVLFLSLFFLASCATTGSQALKEETGETIASKFEKGITHQDEIIAALGEPTETTFTDGGLLVMRYEYERLTPRAQNFIPYNFFSLVSDVKKKELVILLDENNVVQRINMTESEYEQRGGIAE